MAQLLSFCIKNIDVVYVTLKSCKNETIDEYQVMVSCIKEEFTGISGDLSYNKECPKSIDFGHSCIMASPAPYGGEDAFFFLTS